MMKSGVLILAFLAACSGFAKTFTWRITGNDAAAAQFTAYHGETVRFDLQFSGAASNCTADTASILYTTNICKDAQIDVWQTDGLVFHPTNDCGASSYRFFVRARDDLGVNYTANGTLRMLPSPGWEPNALPPPVRHIDFSAVEVANAPWATPADVEAAIAASAPGGYEAVSNKASTVSLPGDDGHPGGLFAPYFGGRAREAKDAYGLIHNPQDPNPGALALGKRGQIGDGGATYSVWWPRFLDAWNGWHWVAGEDHVASAVAAAAAASTNHADEAVAAATNGVFKVDRNSGVGTLLDWGYLYRLGIAWEAYDVLWKLPADPDGESRFIDGATKEINIASTNYVDRKVAAASGAVSAAAAAATNYTDEAIAAIDIPEPDLSAYATTQSVAAVSSSLSSLWTYTLGETCWFAVTNYMRTVGVIPSLQLWEVRDGQTNLVYHSSEEITNTVHTLFGGLAAQFTNALPGRAWGAYQSGTGADNPDPANTTVITTPQVMLTGGGEWNRYVSTGGSSVWVLHSSGMTSFGGGADGNFLKIEDDEGNAAFEVSRTDGYEVDAVPSSCRFDDATGDFTVTYDYDGGSPPVLYASTNLLAGSFIGEDEDHEIDAYGLAVSWAQTATNWTATVSQDAAHPRLFIHAKATMPGSVAIRQNAPVQFGEGGGILYNNKRYVPAVNGNKLEFVEAP